MRQTTASRVAIGVGAALVGLLVIFALSRRGAHEEADTPGTQPAQGHQGHRHEGQEHGTASAGESGAEEQEPSGTVRDGVRVVEMTAQQFEFKPETVVVRQGEQVRLQVTSTDVTHGIAIDEFNVKQMLPPNETKEVTFSATEPGSYQFHCSVFCGSGHGQMVGQIVVQPRPGGGDEGPG